MVSEIMKKFNKDKYLKQLEFKRFYRKYERYFYIGIPCLLVGILGKYILLIQSLLLRLIKECKNDI